MKPKPPARASSREMLKPSVIAAIVVTLTCLLSYTACDSAPVGKERKIADGYRLFKDDDGTIAMFPRGGSAGSFITQIGWRKPFIITVTGADVWQVFDTTSRELPPYLKAEQVHADSRVNDIPLMPVAVAWEQLSENRSQW
jgi:hypothetical protein